MDYITITIYSILSILVSWYLYRSIFAPAVWLQSLWAFFIVLSSVVAYYFFEMPDINGIYVILFINTAFFVGCLMTSLIIRIVRHKNLFTDSKIKAKIRSLKRYKNKIIIDDKYSINESTVHWFMGTVILLSFTGIVLQLMEAGVNIINMSISDIQPIMTNLRYSEQFTPPIYQRMLSYFAYIGVFLASMIYPFPVNKKTKILCLIPLVILLIKSTLFTARFGTLACFLIFMTGYLSSKLYIYKGKINFIKYLLACVVISNLLFAYSFYVDVTKYGSDKIEATKSLSLTMSMFSPLIGFLDWYPSYDDSANLKLGFRTFEGLYDLLGFQKREFGQYTDTVGLLNLESSNIYTVYRGLFEDFSVFGTAVIYFVLGLIVQYIYFSVVKGRIDLIPILSLFYVYVLISFLNSMFIHNSLLFSIIIGIFLWWIVFLKKLKVNKYSEQS